LADNLAQYWVLDKVSAFPWDNRARPAYQLRLVFEEFGGRRGGEVHLRVFWTLLSQQGDKVYLAKRSALLATTAQSSAESYVAALNQLLNQLSYELAIEVRDFLQAENNRAS
nr:PqiC family protein [Cellvibrionaceae bacterium]